MMSAEQRQQALHDLPAMGRHDLANVQMLKRNVEGGGRVDQLRHTDFRLIGGLKGDIGKAWNYDVYGLDAEVHVPADRTSTTSTPIDLQDALIVDGDPNDPSTWHCRSGNARLRSLEHLHDGRGDSGGAELPLAALDL